MKYFHFHSDTHNLDKRLKTIRCEFVKPNKQRCKNRCEMGLSYCWIHTLQQYKVRVEQSTIPNAGLGLFVQDNKKGENDIIFRKGDIICPYNGEIITPEELIERYGNYTAPYGLK